MERDIHMFLLHLDAVSLTFEPMQPGLWTNRLRVRARELLLTISGST